MKKLLLTIMVLGFGSSLALAQTAAHENETSESSMHAQVYDNMADRPEEEGGEYISFFALPERVLEQLKHNELAGHTVISIREIKPEPGDAEAVVLYEMVMQDDFDFAEEEPQLVVRFDEYGEMLSKEEGPLMVERTK